MTFSIDNPEGGFNNPPLGKYVWEKPSGEQGLKPELSMFMEISKDMQSIGAKGRIWFLQGHWAHHLCFY